jgi:hypothetical protein
MDGDHFGLGDCVTCRFTNKCFLEAELLLWALSDQDLPPLLTSGLSTDLLAVNSIGAEVLLGQDDVDTGLHTGLRLRAGVWCDEDHAIGLEGAFFFVSEEEFNFTKGSLGSPPLGVPFTDTLGRELALTLAGPSQSGLATAQLTTRLWGAEANFRTNCFAGPCGQLDFIAGFRALGLDDSFQYNLTSLNSDGSLLFATRDNFATRNRFYGGQVGFDWERHNGCWSLNLIGKVALGCNNQKIEISGSRFLGNNPDSRGLFATPNNIGEFKASDFAVAAEGQVKLGYQLSGCCRATIGYNILVLSNTVRAGEQIDRRLVGGGVPTVSFNTSGFWAQGVTLGLEFRY